jgi:hypothetical protein
MAIRDWLLVAILIAAPFLNCRAKRVLAASLGPPVPASQLPG